MQRALRHLCVCVCDIKNNIYVVCCCRINGFTHLNLTKLDVLSDLPEIKVNRLWGGGGGVSAIAWRGG